jgi:hypothetical protein
VIIEVFDNLADVGNLEVEVDNDLRSEYPVRLYALGNKLIILSLVLEVLLLFDGISLDALSLRTSQLPAIELSAPEHAIGTNTIECIRSGTVLGNAAMLDGMACRLEKELGKPIKTMVATGGLAKEIVACCEKEIVFNKDLVLQGLLVIYKKNR